MQAIILRSQTHLAARANVAIHFKSLALTTIFPYCIPRILNPERCMSHPNQTIFALATAPLKSGVAVLRISGPHAADALTLFAITPPTPRTATLATLRHPNSGETIDSALILTFSAPHSFTGEHVVELHTHGSRAIISELLALLGTLPHFRLAEAGEFSRRAFLNNKMDLTEAEGLADLIDAETTAQARQAARQMQGHLGKRYDTMRSRILRTLALLEAYIDFPDEDIPQSVMGEVEEGITALIYEIDTALGDGNRGERLREGIEIVIIGPPNAGKSTLLNTIAKREIAIVSPEAGTTRDMLEVYLDIGGFPVTLIDTAGLHEGRGEIEIEGIRRARERASKAELVIRLFDITTNTESLNDILAPEGVTTLTIFSKSDTAPERIKPDMLTLSAHTGEGIDALLSAITTHITSRYTGAESSLITRQRHRTALEQCRTHLAHFSPDTPLELNGEELRLAARALATITGNITVDDVLDIVFSSFCIGK